MLKNKGIEISQNVFNVAL